MFHRKLFQYLLVISIVISVAFINQTSAATSETNEILNPAPFVWTYVDSPEPHYVGVLEYGEATFTINGQTLTTRAYRQEGGAYSIPGPTLNMKPGNSMCFDFEICFPMKQPA